MPHYANNLLENLFGAKAKVLRLFFQHPRIILTQEDICRRAGVKKREGRRFVADLVKSGVLKKTNSNKIVKRRRFNKKLCQLNARWPFLTELKNLVLKIAPPAFPKIEKKISRLGRIKLAVLTGVFLNIPDTRVDIMVVGDDLDFRRFGDFIKKLESDMGTELRYVVLGAEEFKYRFDMFDRFVHDILEYPHRKVINKLKA